MKLFYVKLQLFNHSYTPKVGVCSNSLISVNKEQFILSIL